MAELNAMSAAPSAAPEPASTEKKKMKKSKSSGRVAPSLPPTAAKKLAKDHWKSTNATLLKQLRTAKTMFDDGRFAQSIVSEASSSGAPKPTPAALKRMSTSGITRPPTMSDMVEGFDGGGGVRLHPPHLDEALQQLG